MTQKELAYIEDAIGHEKSIIKICEDSLTRMEDSSLKDFIQGEISKHQDMKEKLMTLLEEKVNG